MISKKTGGRLRKYSTQEEAQQADLAGRQRRRQQAYCSGVADFIPYQPSLYAGIPTNTPLSIGLRTSSDIQILRDHNVYDVLPSDTLQNEYLTA